MAAGSSSGFNFDPGNRFSCLSQDTDSFPELGNTFNRYGKRKLLDLHAIPTGHEKNQTRFLVIYRNEGEEDMKKVSPFLIDRSLNKHIGCAKNISRLRDGNILVETYNQAQTNKLLAMTHINDKYQIKVEPHKTLNITKGLVNCYDFNYLTDEEIIEELESVNVIAIRRMKKKVNGEIRDTSLFVLTFNSPQLPADIKAGIYLLRVRPYIPSPLRCFDCQQFGHMKTKCTETAVCGICAKKPHTDISKNEKCNNKAQCVNCNNEHPSFSRKCPKYIEEYTIQKIKVERKMSYKTARQEFFTNTPTYHSYAKITQIKSNISENNKRNNTDRNQRSNTHQGKPVNSHTTRSTETVTPKFSQFPNKTSISQSPSSPTIPITSTSLSITPQNPTNTTTTCRNVCANEKYNKTNIQEFKENEIKILNHESTNNNINESNITNLSTNKNQTDLTASKMDEDEEQL